MTLQLHENTAEQHLCLLGDEKLLADPICEHLSTGQSARKGVAGVEKEKEKEKEGKREKQNKTLQTWRLIRLTSSGGLKPGRLVS